jgi:outer membrane lipoprotein-sorting protein
LLRFKAPPDIAGVALLAVEGQNGAADDVLLFLPKIKRSRRIAASQRGQSFMDTDFSYADFSGSGSVDEKSAERLADEKVDAADCYVLSGKAPADSPYRTVKAWIDKANSVPRKVEYYGAEGTLTKRLTANKVGALNGRTLALESTMESLASGTRTTVTIHSLETGAFADEAFTERGLERG